MVVKLNDGDKLEVVEGGFVWMRDEKLHDGEMYLEWDSIHGNGKGAIIDLRDKIESLTEELAQLLSTLCHRSKDAA